MLFMDTKLGRRIKERLTEIRQNQSWLAEQVNLTPSQITHIIKGNRGTNIDTLIKIGVVLGISQDEIVRLYRNEKANDKTPVRKIIDMSLDRIEKTDPSRLSSAADYLEMLANSLQGKTNEKSKGTSSKA